MTHSLPPTLRLDDQQAWRQSDDAVIIPIVYCFPDWPSEPPVEMVIAAPSFQTRPGLSTPVLAGAELPDWPNSPDWPDWPEVDEEEERRLAALKKKADSEEFQLPHYGQEEVDSFFIINPTRPFGGHTNHLSTAVPLLLLGGVALVVFAWVAFR